MGQFTLFPTGNGMKNHFKRSRHDVREPQVPDNPQPTAPTLRRFPPPPSPPIPPAPAKSKAPLPSITPTPEPRSPSRCRIRRQSRPQALPQVRLTVRTQDPPPRRPNLLPASARPKAPLLHARPPRHRRRAAQIQCSADVVFAAIDGL